MLRYNGWTNRATWLVNLWLGDHLDYIAQDGIKIDSDYVSGLVSDLHDELNLGSSLFEDLLNDALSDVDWDEIAEHYQGETE